jgi:glutamate synthase (NADPH) small chain
LPVPPAERSPLTPWPLWPLQLRQESSHEEGGDRDWSVATTSFSGEGRVQRLHGIRVGPAPRFEPESGTAFEIEADLVLLAMGFTGPARDPLLAQLGVNFDSRGNIAVDGRRMTSVEGVFAAGDARRGQSLVVWAIAEGRQAAEEIHRWLLPH